MRCYPVPVAACPWLSILKIAKYRNSRSAIPLNTLLTACNAPSGRADAPLRLTAYLASG